MFLFHEDKEILSIKILDTEDDDILAWHFEKKISYLLELHINLQLKPDPRKNCGTSTYVEKKVFHAIWKPLCQNCTKETPHLVVWI
jgi:hypothetical protein